MTNRSSTADDVPMSTQVLTSQQLIAAIEERTFQPGSPEPTVLLVVLSERSETGESVPASSEVTLQVGRRLSAMTRESDLIAALEPGEVALVAFDLPAVQRRAFADGIETAIESVLLTLETDAGGRLSARIGTSTLTGPDAIAAAFRAADRRLVEPVSSLLR